MRPRRVASIGKIVAGMKLIMEGTQEQIEDNDSLEKDDISTASLPLALFTIGGMRGIDDFPLAGYLRGVTPELKLS